jgi:hypothetical protein
LQGNSESDNCSREAWKDKKNSKKKKSKKNPRNERKKAEQKIVSYKAQVCFGINIRYVKAENTLIPCPMERSARPENPHHDQKDKKWTRTGEQFILSIVQRKSEIE